MQKVNFSQTEWFSDLASRLDWIASSSRELTAWPAKDFCPVVQQLTWHFISSTCFTHVPTLATWQPRASHEIQLRGSVLMHTLELFFTHSHTQPLHDSHLYTGFLNVELQTNCNGIKPIKRLIKFNLTRCIDSERSNVMMWMEPNEKLQNYVIKFMWEVIYAYFYNWDWSLFLVLIVYDLVELIIEVSH